MRTECFFNNEILHIADFFTTKNGMQVAIEGEIEKLRAYGRKGQLICACGCGGKLRLVAGKRMRRRQHFRLKSGQNVICKAHEESLITINAKVIIKCWLDDILGLQNGEILLNTPINKMSDGHRRFEYTHYVPRKKIGICYERIESNLNDEKINLLSEQSGITNLCITDIKNDGCGGQYPEFAIKVQKIQGYYAMLVIDEMTLYEEARLKIVRYEKSYLGTWVQIDVCEDMLSKYSFFENSKLCLSGMDIYSLALRSSNEYLVEQEKQRELAEKKAEEYRRKADEERKEEERKRQEAERKQREKIERKKQEDKERREFWEQYKIEKELRESCYNEEEIVPDEVWKELSEAEVLDQNPQIKVLKEYIAGLNTLKGTFKYVSLKDRSSISRSEKIKVAKVKFNPRRNRMEILSDRNERYIIYLKFGKNTHINTDHTREGYLVFELQDIEECDIISKFRQVVECNDEKYIERYVCTLTQPCEYKGEQPNICTYTSDDNKCGFRERV